MTKRFSIIFFVSILFLTSNAFSFTIRTKNNKANKLFKKEEYKKALSLYGELDEIVEKKGKRINSTLKFNKANSYLKLNNYD